MGKARKIRGTISESRIKVPCVRPRDFIFVMALSATARGLVFAVLLAMFVVGAVIPTASAQAPREGDISYQSPPRYALSAGGIMAIPFSAQGAHAFDTGLEVTLTRIHFEEARILPWPTWHYGVGLQFSLSDFVHDGVPHDLTTRAAVAIHGGYLGLGLQTGIYARAGFNDGSDAWGGFAGLYISMVAASLGVQLEGAFGSHGQAAMLDTRVLFVWTLKWPFYYSPPGNAPNVTRADT